MTTERGFLVVADITGYTSYLSHSELEHAEQVLTALLGLLIDHTRPPLTVSRLAGDAVLSYSLDGDRFDGQAFVEMIEESYIAFRRAMDLMVLNTTCECNACANINTLDLKFFVHHGEFVIQRHSIHDELVGSDVNLIHRLMKNRVTEEVGVRAYTLYTDAAVRSIGVEGLIESLTPYSQHIDDLGDVEAWVQDMAPIWERGSARDHLSIDPDDRFLEFEAVYPLPPELVWPYLIDPDLRAVFSHSVSQRVSDRRNGRIGEGSVYQCFHGGGFETTNTVLEWVPFERAFTENTYIGSTRFFSEMRLEPVDEGTRVTLTYGTLRGPILQRAVCTVIARIVLPRFAQKGMARLGGLIDDDLAAGRVSVPMPGSVDTEQIASAAHLSVRDLGR